MYISIQNFTNGQKNRVFTDKKKLQNQQNNKKRKRDHYYFLNYYFNYVQNAKTKDKKLCLHLNFYVNSLSFRTH